MSPRFFAVGPGPDTTATTHLPAIRRTGQHDRIASPRRRRHRHTTVPQTGQKSGHSARRGADSYSATGLSRPRTAWPFVRLCRWSLCRSVGAPDRPGGLHSQRLKQPAARPVARCGFVPKRLPDRVPNRVSAGPASPPRDRPEKRPQKRSQPHSAPHFLLRKAFNYLDNMEVVNCSIRQSRTYVPSRFDVRNALFVLEPAPPPNRHVAMTHIRSRRTCVIKRSRGRSREALPC